MELTAKGRQSDDCMNKCEVLTVKSRHEEKVYGPLRAYDRGQLACSEKAGVNKAKGKMTCVRPHLG